MKNILQRTLSALVCLAMLLSCVPAWSESEPMPVATLEIVEELPSTPEPTAEPVPEATPIPEEAAVPEAAPLPEGEPAPEAANSAEPTAEPAPGPTPIPETEDETEILTMVQVLSELGGEPEPIEESPFTIADGVLTAYCGSEAQVVVPDGVTAIAASAFEGNPSITAVTLPDGLLSIGENAFCGCIALKQLYIPESTTEFGADFLAYCTAVQVSTPEGSPAAAWCAENGVACAEILPPLYDYTISDGKAAIISYNGSDAIVELPAEFDGCPVTAIGDQAFYGCSFITSLTLPDSLRSIGSYAFAGCSAMESLSLPFDAAIGENAFEGCTALTLQVFEGSAADAYCAANSIPCTYREPILPTKIIPARSTITIGYGEKYSLDGWTLEPEGARTTVTYSSKSSSIAKVGTDGVVTGRKAGSSTTITLKTDNGKKCTVKVNVRKAPTSIKLSAERSLLGVKETLQLKPSFSSKAYSGVVNYTSSDETIASVSASGLLTAHSPGIVEINASTFNGKHTKSPLVIEVCEAPTEISLLPKTLALGRGDSKTLSYTLSENAASKVIFESSDTSVATVDANGKVKASSKKSGTATITARTHVDGVLDTCEVTVVAAPTSVSISAPKKTIGAKDTLQLSASIKPADAASTLKYSSSKSSVATVDSATGLVTAKKAGKATITVKTHNGKKKSVTITVKNAPSSIKIVAERTVLGKDETLQLSHKLSSGSAATVTYSTDSEFLTVTADGLVTAVAPGGPATVTAATHNEKSATLDFTILEAPTEISLLPETLALGRGDSKTLSYTLSENAASKVIFESSDTSVATVDANGKVKASSKKSGTATITARTHVDGVLDTCEVTVVAAPTSVSISAPKKTIGAKDTLQLSASIKPADAASTLKYSSSKSSVATVDSATGLVTAKKAGTATITVKTHNGKKKSVTITVKKEPTKVTVVTPRERLAVGDSLQLNHKLSSGSAATVTYGCITPELASVTETGLVTAVAVGTAQFTGTAHNGVVSAPCSIEIVPEPTAILLTSKEFLPDTTSFLLGVDQTAALSARVNEESAGIIRFHSENPDVAVIDPETGKITAKGVGKTRLVATTYLEGLAAYADIEVRPKPDSVSLDFTSVKLGKNDTLQLNPTIDEGSHTKLSYSSSSKTYVTVSETGLVTAVKAGEATVTVSTHNGKKFKLKVYVKKAPSSITAVPAAMTLGLGEESLLNYKLSSGSIATVTLSSDDSAIASVDAAGNVRAEGIGTTTLRLSTHNDKHAECVVNVVPAPTGIQLTTTADVLGVGMGADSSTALLPAGSSSAVTYSIMSSTLAAAPAEGEEPLPVISIDANGSIKALNPGKAVVRACTYLGDVYDERTITVKPAPTSITFDQEKYSIDVNTTMQLFPILSEGSCGTVSYKIKKAGFFTIDDATGIVTPIMRGTTTVTATTHNKVSTTIEIHIFDPTYPETMVLTSAVPTYLEKGDSFTPTIAVTPEAANPVISWSSSDTKVATVNETTGVVKAVSYGKTTITGKSTRNPSLKISYELVVLNEDRCLIMPKTRTDVSRIETTLNEIRSIRASAYNELAKLLAEGTITQKDYDKRYGYIKRAFDMHLFPWMTETKELYWKAANSEGGNKDFKPGMVYYGLPYTQSNREYNVSKALNKGYFKDSGEGYYLMKGSKFSSRAYPGNDCSSFASMAIWGTGSSVSYLSTSGIAKNAAYRNLSNWKNLRPGDLLNKGGSHVVMFLYYANEAKTQMVIIEQGGSTSKDRGIDNKAYSNTVACSIKNVSYYTSRGYKIRRVASLG